MSFKHLVDFKPRSSNATTKLYNAMESIHLDIQKIAKGRHQKKNCIKSEIGIIYLTPLPPYLKSEKQKNEILVCLRPPLPPG